MSKGPGIEVKSSSKGSGKSTFNFCRGIFDRRMIEAHSERNSPTIELALVKDEL